MIVFLKEFFEKVNFEKKSHQTTTKACKGLRKIEEASKLLHMYISQTYNGSAMELDYKKLSEV